MGSSRRKSSVSDKDRTHEVRPPGARFSGDHEAEKVVEEGGHRFRVNLTDYLDTGLFLDQRNTRALLQREAAGRRFLNLFCYTASATVYAIKGGAVSSTSVDMSSTYLDWARDNLQLNGIGGSAHRIERSDCLRWLQRHRGRYDLIYLDPPTFSNSKSMQRTLDIQRDHVELLQSTLRLLEPSGAIVFATNRRDFKLDQAALADLQLEDLSRSTLPQDFARNARIRQVWRVQHKPDHR
jgi:23S rRNA (guanine2445-N2)-methyltransferase / 23S rRNA (guanine2069-N7)-methyltransferase